MRRLVIGLGVLLFLSSGVSASEPLLRGIKGDDDRILVQSREYPWSAIGRLNKRTGGHCTGTLIGPDLVLTAAHCLWNKRTRRFLPNVSLHFVAGWQSGEFLAHSKVKDVYVSKGYRPKPDATPRLDLDWALVTLEEPVGEKTGYLGVEKLDRAILKKRLFEQAGFVQAGYSQDKKHMLTVHAGCRLSGFANGGHILTHFCDAVSGDSGAPIFRFDGKGFRIVAIHVATTTHHKPVLGLAVPSAAFLEKAGERSGREGGEAPVTTLREFRERLAGTADSISADGTGPVQLGRLIEAMARKNR